MLLPTDNTFGREVHDLLLAMYGQPVLSSYWNIQELISADRESTVSLLFGAEAVATDRFRHALPEDIVKEIAERVETATRLFKDQNGRERKQIVLSGLLDILGNALNTLGQ